MQKVLLKIKKVREDQSPISHLSTDFLIIKGNQRVHKGFTKDLQGFAMIHKGMLIIP